MRPGQFRSTACLASHSEVTWPRKPPMLAIEMKDTRVCRRIIRAKSPDEALAARQAVHGAELRGHTPGFAPQPPSEQLRPAFRTT